jgi:hypothetical protein
MTDPRLERLERAASTCTRCEDPNVCQSCPERRALREYKEDARRTLEPKP